MRAFEGKYVEITLDYADPGGRVEGHLLYITDVGEVAYVYDDRTMYGWPCLAVAAKGYPCCKHCREEEGGCGWNVRHVVPCCEEQ